MPYGPDAKGAAEYIRADIVEDLVSALMRVETIMERTDWDLNYASDNACIREEVESALANYRQTETTE